MGIGDLSVSNDFFYRGGPEPGGQGGGLGEGGWAGAERSLLNLSWAGVHGRGMVGPGPEVLSLGGEGFRDNEQ